MERPADLFADVPHPLPDELFTTLLDAADVRIERIVSHGHASPEGFWYDQDRHEWVVLLKGAARLRFEDDVLEMQPGSFIHIPAHRKHRVEWTTPDEPTIWLAVHYEVLQRLGVCRSKASLLPLLVQIAVEQQRPLSLAEFVQSAFEAGYRAEKDFAGLILAALQKLTRQGTLVKDAATGKYHVAPDSPPGAGSEAGR